MCGMVVPRVDEEPRPDPPAVGVADPDPCVREGLCALLESCGFEVRSYEDAEKLPEADSLPGCLVLDLGLPGLTPSELLDRVRLLRPHTRVIVTVSCPEPGVAADLLRAGAVEVLEKPFPPERLIGLVTEAVARSARAAP